MAFVNEYASDEDIEKYKLNDVWDRYRPYEKNRFWGRKPELTIDRERDIFLMVHSRGAVSSGTQYKLLFSIEGQEVFVLLNLVEGSSLEFSDRPFFMVWDFVKIDELEKTSLTESEIIEEIKSAVTEYGYNGVRDQVPDTIVKFNF